MKRMLQHKGLLLGSIMVGTVFIVVLFGPVLTSRDPYQQVLPRALQPPDSSLPFGADSLGRDLLARVIYGCRYTVSVGLVAVLVGASVGTAIGVWAGYSGGLVDQLVGRVVDGMLAFPGLLLALAIVAMLGGGLVNLAIAMSIGSIPRFARLARGTTLSVKNEEYIEAVRASGATHLWITLRHILPNITSPLTVQASYSMATAILTASGLSYLGLGAEPPLPEWGLMLSSARTYMRTAPHLSLFPGLAIVFVIIGLNVLGDALRDITDPRIRRSVGTLTRN